MHIQVLDYQKQWPQQFKALSHNLAQTLEPFRPQIEHIGSTAVPGLAAKSIIDIAVGLKGPSQLDQIISLMLDAGYIYYEIYNETMPERRLFIALKDQDQHKFPRIFRKGDQIPYSSIHKARIANIHCWVEGSSEWIRHITFREYLKNFPSVRDQYGDLKKRLSLEKWENMMDYNREKNDFIQAEEAIALR